MQKLQSQARAISKRHMAMVSQEMYIFFGFMTKKYRCICLERKKLAGSGKPFTEYGYCLKGTATTCSLFPSDCKSDEVFKKPGEQYDIITTDRSGATTTTKQDAHCPCYKVHTGGCKKNKVIQTCVEQIITSTTHTM